jgi:hypothetical protein
MVGETLVGVDTGRLDVVVYLCAQINRPRLRICMGGHTSLFAPRKSGDDPNNMVMNRHFDSMNRQLFDS